MNFKEIIDYIKSMNEKDRLKLAIRLSETDYSNIAYNKKELFEKFDTRLKELDENYRKNLDIPKLILMIVARITELKKEEQNQIALYLIRYITRTWICNWFLTFFYKCSILESNIWHFIEISNRFKLE